MNGEVINIIYSYVLEKNLKIDSDVFLNNLMGEGFLFLGIIIILSGIKMLIKCWV